MSGALAVPLHALERGLDGIFGTRSNPLRQLGALGFHLFWIVVASGAYVYAFFDASIVGAYRSLESTGPDQWFVNGVVRGIHRYSADAFAVVTAIHLVRELVYGRFRGFRWFSWISGVPLLWLALAAGIGGYWLAWDQLAQFIGIATAEWFAALPGFDPGMVRNFVVAGNLSDRLFSLLVFLHIGLPLLLLLGMWIHIQRITGASTQPDARLGWATLGTLVLLSLVKPALSQASVDPAIEPARISLDWFYLFAYPGIDRFSPAAVWYLAFGATALLCALPWLRAKPRAPVAVVDPDNCNGCGRCLADCPYEAVVMQPRTGARAGLELAVVREDLCAGCGVCAGACPSSTPFRRAATLVTGIDLPQIPVDDLRARMEAAIDELQRPKVVVFGCDCGAPVHSLAGDTAAAFSLPCIGMLPPSFIEYALRSGADGVMIIGCADGECEYRLGVEWTRRRIAGAREPHLRAGVPLERVALAWPYAHERERVLSELEAFRAKLCSIDAAVGRLPRRRQKEARHV